MQYRAEDAAVEAERLAAKREQERVDGVKLIATIDERTEWQLKLDHDLHQAPVGERATASQASNPQAKRETQAVSDVDD